MSTRVLIIDGYPKKSRDEFDHFGMTLSYQLYANMLYRYLPEAEVCTWLASDSEQPRDGADPASYAAVLWTGCNLTIYDHDNPVVTRQIELSRRAYEVGTPQFGSCWGLQMAVFAAGGEITKHPLGREMGLARKIHLTGAGHEHPMMKGKPQVFSAFISHDDQVTGLPAGATLLASNDYTHVQAVAVEHKKGVFWATQYHPEYDLGELACLTESREAKLTRENFFRNHDDLIDYVAKLKALAAEPTRKDLRWLLDIDDDVLDADRRQIEFANWVEQILKPHLAGR